VDVLDLYHARKHNVIYAFENLGTINFEVESNKRKLQQLSEQWDVEIVLTYRHYHEFVPSFYTEMYKFHSLRMHYDPLGALLQDTQLWPEEGGVDLASFADIFDGQFGKPLFPSMEHLYVVNMLSVYHNFLQIFETIGTIDIHESLSAAKWVCKLPGAYSACSEALQLAEFKEDDEAEFTGAIAVDLVASAAHKAGLVAPSLTRKFVQDEVQKRVAALGEHYSFPSKCLSSVQMQELHKLSEKVADVMAITTSSIDSTFDKVQSANKFCGVDTDKVLADVNWVEFFLDLEEETQSLFAKQ
jgi:hypothetical protein